MSKITITPKHKHWRAFPRAIRVSDRTHKRLRELSRTTGRAIGEIVEIAVDAVSVARKAD
jgi:hypothetical protein